MILDRISSGNSILISGAGGFLGTILTAVLQAQKYSVNKLTAKDGATPDIRYPFAIPETAYDIVIHAAGKAHTVPRTIEEGKIFFDVNFNGTKNLCYAIEKLPALPSSFIFISTVAVYGKDSGENISESHPLNGDTPYAESKILAERWLNDWASHNRVKLGILRLPLIVGPNPPGNLGAMIDGIRLGKYLSIGKADARKSMVWADDVAKIIPILAKRGGTYNLTDGYHPSFSELENAIASTLKRNSPFHVPYWVAKSLASIGDLVGKPFPIDSYKLKKILSTLTFDDSKARLELGWNPTPVLSKIPEIIL